HAHVKINEALDQLCETYLEKHDPLRKAQRKQRQPVSLQSISPQPARLKTRSSRQPISASTKHHVWLRDQGQCRFHQNGRRCENRKYLEVHHKKPVALGGENQSENLVLLCHEHHKTVHMRF
ncbi:MAG: HNH endonuclease, partial [Bdellovibrionales bacterium]|nr:HNH endonuclease [Bdellovibrionales bacterium]